jgi:hypothetical protein
MPNLILFYNSVFLNFIQFQCIVGLLEGVYVLQSFSPRCPSVERDGRSDLADGRFNFRALPKFNVQLDLHVDAQRCYLSIARMVTQGQFLVLYASNTLHDSPFFCQIVILFVDPFTRGEVSECRMIISWLSLRSVTNLQYPNLPIFRFINPSILYVVSLSPDSM